ncbi:hypothetical protein Lal_00015446 [Lupinus albus]|nr:hypothetical protein Lal_00015446 [Lupinus albus]
MDAISFVLGIKSSHLRSAHLKDLVYRGRVLKTAKINDDGSAQTNGDANGDADGNDKASRGDPKTAWVMAVYEDDAGEEQKWKRSITNQGASEYRINDRVVTAQQYNESLESENILIKARNFLVFQGDVEAIASQSPQDLTRLIEQISGSLEYKAEYEKTQLEAEQAAENQNFQLHRRRGINSEIKQYREQKKEADNFQNKTDERDAAIVTHSLWKLYHFQKAMEDSFAAIQDHQENLKELRRNVESFEKRLEAARKEQAAAHRQVARLDKEIKAKERNIEDKENSLVPIEEKINESTQAVETLQAAIAKATKERDEQAEVVRQVQKDIESVEKARQVFENDYKEQMKKQGREISDEDRREYNRLRTQLMSRTGKVDSIAASIEKIEAELSSIEERKSAAQATSKDLSQEIEAKKKEFNKLQSERVRTNQKRTELEEKLEDVARKLREADDGRRQNDREARMKEMVTSLKRMFPGVRGRVGDLCKPKQKKYDEAVIVALGRDFDAVVVDSEKIGVECVQYLKEQRFQPMTFIPLDNIKVNAVNTAVKGFSGARLTIDTIDFDSSVERAMSYACGSSVVCDTLDIAKHICYEKKIPVKAVTLEGYIIHKAGLMTGGRGPESKSKRRFEEADVQNLQRMATKLKDEIDRLPKADRRGSQEEPFKLTCPGSKGGWQPSKTNWQPSTRTMPARSANWTTKRGNFESSSPNTKNRLPSLKAPLPRAKNFGLQSHELKMKCLQISVDDSVIAIFEATVTRKASWSRRNDIKSYAREKDAIENAMREEHEELEALREALDENKSELTEKNQKVSEAKLEVQKRSKDIEAYLKDINSLKPWFRRTAPAKRHYFDDAD